MKTAIALCASLSLLALSSADCSFAQSTETLGLQVNQQPDQTAAGDTVEATLNGLKISFDKQSGGIVGLDYPRPGEMLKASPDRAGMIDIAYPKPQFETLRLA